MARKIKGFPAGDAGAATAEGEGATATAESEVKVAKAPETKRKWLPLPMKDDGTPDTEALPPAEFTEKIRPVRLLDGSTAMSKVQVFVKAGEARYSLSDGGELIAWFRKRGGVGRKLVYQFKRQYSRDERGRTREKREKEFRVVLRRAGVPGA